MRKFSWIDIIIIVLFLLAVYLILTRIFWGSASDLAIMITLFSFLCGLIFRLTFFILNFWREFGGFKIKTINSFASVKQDFNNIKDDITLIKNDMSLVKKKLKIK